MFLESIELRTFRLHAIILEFMKCWLSFITSLVQQDKNWQIFPVSSEVYIIYNPIDFINK